MVTASKSDKAHISSLYFITTKGTQTEYFSWFSHILANLMTDCIENDSHWSFLPSGDIYKEFWHDLSIILKNYYEGDTK